MKALVTGGGGFLGGAVAALLLERGDDVRTLNRRGAPRLAARGAAALRGDVTDPVAVDAAVRGVDVVFHVAAKTGSGGPPGPYERINVEGTRNVVTACRRHGVGRLVHTSTPSVVHAGRDIAGGTEALPYARSYEAAYPRTKAAAERLVLAASGPDLATVALRPHLVWGPGDTHLVPGIVARARSGRLRLVAGGTARVDSTYIDDAAAAHVLAADRLMPGTAPAGHAYFVSAGQPLPVAELVNGILAAAGLPSVTASIPFPVAYALGAAAEAAYRVLRRDDEPPMTRFLARQLATSHWFDLTGARRDLGYIPRVSVDEGMARLRAHLRAAPSG